MNLPTYTIGMGDRFRHQGEAQLRAVVEATKQGVDIVPVWNKSNREHTIVGTAPGSLREEADQAVLALGWTNPYFVDADHIGLATVDGFLDASDFFTLDVADYVGKPAGEDLEGRFRAAWGTLVGSVQIDGIAEPVVISEDDFSAAVAKFLRAIHEAGEIYRHIVAKKSAEGFVTEVSVDETDTPQSPKELLLILAMIAFEKIPAQTIAPKFTGRFNKGVDYVGDLAQFEREFDADLAVIRYAKAQFDLHPGLKLSVHSGSDKFSLYPIIKRHMRAHGVGIHLKTAGTTWLEELIGLAEAGGSGLELAKEIYRQALPKYDALVAPYAAVVDIDPAALPTADEVDAWDSEAFTAALRHDPSAPGYNLHFRQFLHVSFKIAAGMGTRYTEALKTHAETIGRNVTTNLLDRHILPLFGK